MIVLWSPRKPLCGLIKFWLTNLWITVCINVSCVSNVHLY